MKRYEFLAIKGNHTYHKVTDNKIQFILDEWEARINGYTTKIYIYE